jgi:nucleotide-binding universal stress UspA family protein
MTCAEGAAPDVGGRPDASPAIDWCKMSRFQHILAATDFSPDATNAVEWAVSLAREQGARITVIHALEKVPASKPPGDIRSELLESLGAVEQVVAESDVEVASIYRPGRAWEVIAAAAGEVGADLVVVGARGRTGLASLLVGSTAERVVRGATVPVVTVHPEHQPRDPADPRVIVVATDFSDQAAAATRCAEMILHAAPGPGHLVLMHAWQPLVQYEMDAAVGVTVNPLDDTQEQAEEMLGSIAAPLRERGLEVETVIRQGYPAGAIRKEAEAVDASLIALGTHGRSGLEHFMLGSVAERILRHARCPVLTARGGA